MIVCLNWVSWQARSAILDRAGAIPDGRVAAGRQQPGQVVQRFDRVRVELQGLLETPHRLPGLARLIKTAGQVEAELEICGVGSEERS